jgi:hypothetical protein
MSNDPSKGDQVDRMPMEGPQSPPDALSERLLGEQAGAAWGERLEAHLRRIRDMARQQVDSAALIAHQREQRHLEILARLAGQAFLLERVARIVLQVAPVAQEARFLIARTATGLGFVGLTTDAGRELRWDRTRLESAHELGEDWWDSLEDQFIDEAEAQPGDSVVINLLTREVTYLHGRHGAPGLNDDATRW